MYRVVLQSGNVVVAWFLGLEAQSGQLWLAFQDEEEDVEEWVPWAAVARCRLLSTGDQE